MSTLAHDLATGNEVRRTACLTQQSHRIIPIDASRTCEPLELRAHAFELRAAGVDVRAHLEQHAKQLAQHGRIYALGVCG
jgi:hypothetical protein